jgi:hypothetical protein
MEMWFTVREDGQNVDFIIYGENIMDCYVELLRLFWTDEPTIIFACTAY